MSVDLLLIIISLVVLLVASITDLKTREVPDYLSYGFIISILGIRLIYSFYSDFSYFWHGFLGFFAMFLFGAVMYYLKQWGGADAKLFMGLGAVFGSLFYGRVPLLLILVLMIFFIGAFYSAIWATVLFFKDFRENWKEFLNLLRQYRYLRYASLALSLIFLIIIFYKQTTLTLILFVFSIASFFLILFGVFLRVVENKSFLKEISLSKVTEGDWLAKDVIKFLGSLTI